MSKLPLDDVAFYDLMSECQDEMAWYDELVRDKARRAAQLKLIAPEAWEWIKSAPFDLPIHSPDLRTFLQRYIDQMTQLRNAGISGLPDGHVGKVYGDRLLKKLEDDKARKLEEAERARVQHGLQQYVAQQYPPQPNYGQVLPYDPNDLMTYQPRWMSAQGGGGGSAGNIGGGPSNIPYVTVQPRPRPKAPSDRVELWDKRYGKNG